MDGFFGFFFLELICFERNGKRFCLEVKPISLRNSTLPHSVFQSTDLLPTQHDKRTLNRLFGEMWEPTVTMMASDIKYSVFVRFCNSDSYTSNRSVFALHSSESYNVYIYHIFNRHNELNPGNVCLIVVGSLCQEHSATCGIFVEKPKGKYSDYKIAKLQAVCPIRMSYIIYWFSVRCVVRQRWHVSKHRKVSYIKTHQMPKHKCFSIVLQLPFCNILKPSVKWRMKM